MQIAKKISSVRNRNHCRRFGWAKLISGINCWSGQDFWLSWDIVCISRITNSRNCCTISNCSMAWILHIATTGSTCTTTGLKESGKLSLVDEQLIFRCTLKLSTVESEWSHHVVGFEMSFHGEDDRFPLQNKVEEVVQVL